MGLSFYVVKNTISMEDAYLASNVYLFFDRTDAVKKVNELFEELKESYVGKKTDSTYKEKLKVWKQMCKKGYGFTTYVLKEKDSFKFSSEDYKQVVEIEKVALE